LEGFACGLREFRMRLPWPNCSVRRNGTNATATHQPAAHPKHRSWPSVPVDLLRPQLAPAQNIGLGSPKSEFFLCFLCHGNPPRFRAPKHGAPWRHESGRHRARGPWSATGRLGRSEITSAHRSSLFFSGWTTGSSFFLFHWKKCHTNNNLTQWAPVSPV